MIEFDVASIDMTHESAPDGVANDEVPIIHLFGYDTEGCVRHAEVEGVQSYMYVPHDEVGDGIETHPQVRDVNDVGEDGEPFRTVRGERVSKLVTYTPGQVPSLRSLFSTTWESDIPFPTRVMIDNMWGDGVRVPTTDRRLDASEVESASVSAEWRIHYTDIEVDDVSGFPENGEQPIICVTAYDSFEDEYVVWLQDDGVPQIDEDDYTAESDMHDASVDVRLYDNEVDMLRSYFAYIGATEPAVISGWYSNDFDVPYLIDRADVLESETDDNLGLGLESISPLNTIYNGNWGPECKGPVLFDLMEGFAATQFTEMDSYRLEAVAQERLGIGKEEYVGRIGDLWRDRPGKLVDYNLRDVELLVELDRQEAVIEFWREVQDIVHCPLSDTVVESTAVDRYILQKYHSEVVFPNQGSQPETDEEYAGGAVFDPITGIREWVATLDLASLYPMSMATLNASPETKVDPDEFDGPTIQSPNEIHFRADQQGFTVQIIEDLLEEREKKKTQRDSCDPESDEYAVYDRQQTAIKVIMNALYGALAWQRFRVYDQDVASAVTATGRACIEHTADVVDDLGYELLYGDSVPGYEPVYIRDEAGVDVCPIESVVGRVRSGERLETWSDDGWVEIQDGVAKPNRKQIYRVITRSGVVHVTEDHGLLRPDGTEVPPTAVELGEELLHAPQRVDCCTVDGLPDKDGFEPSDMRAWLLGVFVGDGTAGSYTSAYGRKSQWKVSKDDERLLRDVAAVMESKWGVHCEVSYVDDPDRTGVVRPVGNEDGTIPELVAAFRELCYDAYGNKRVPRSVLLGDRETMLSFLDGYRRADGEDSSRDRALFKRAYTASHTLAGGLTVLANRLGMSLGVAVHDNHDSEYIRFWFREWCRGDRTEVLSVEPVEYGGNCVYDLSTESEHFNAGVGTITVHNTDSALIQMGTDTEKEELLDAAFEIEEAINTSYDEFASGVLGTEMHRFDIEFEKLYRRYFQAGKKKRYSGHIVWKEGKDVDDIDITGFEYERSDYSAFAKSIQYDVLEMLVTGADVDEVRAHLREVVEQWQSRAVSIGEIGKPGGIGKPLYDYAADTHTSRAAKYGNLLVGAGLTHGDKCQRYYLDGVHPSLFERMEDDVGLDPSEDFLYAQFKSDPEMIGVARAEQLPAEIVVDWEKMRQKNIDEVTEGIAESVGIDWEHVLTGQQQTGLDAFM